MVALSPRFAMILALVVAATAAPSSAGTREVHDFEGYDAKGAGQTVYYDENDHYAKKRGDDDIVTGYKDDTVDTQYHSYDGYKRSVIPAKREVHDFEGYDAKGAGQTVYYDENDHYAKREVHDFEGYDAKGAGQTVYYDENDHYARKRGDDDIVTGYKDDTVDTQYHSYDGYRKRGDDDIVTGYKDDTVDTQYHSYDGYKRSVIPAKREVHDFEGYNAHGAGQTAYYNENDHYAKKRGDDDIVTGYKDDTVDTQYHSYDGYKRRSVPSKREVHDFEGYDAKGAGQTVYYDENDHYARKRGDDDIVTGYKDDTVDTQYHSYDGYKRSVIPAKREVHDFEGYDAKGAGQTVYYDENDHYAKKRGDDDIVTGYKDDTVDTQYHSYDGYRKREVEDVTKRSPHHSDERHCRDYHHGRCHSYWYKK